MMATMPQDSTGSVHFLYTEEQVINIIYKLHGPKFGFRQIADFLEGDWTHMDVYRIACFGEFPRGDEKRAALNLPPVYRVPPCPECGELHVIGECTQGKVVTVKPRRNGKPRRRQPPNVYIGYTTPEEWRIISAMTPAERLRAMIEYGKDKR